MTAIGGLHKIVESMIETNYKRNTKMLKHTENLDRFIDLDLVSLPVNDLENLNWANNLLGKATTRNARFAPDVIRV